MSSPSASPAPNGRPSSAGPVLLRQGSRTVVSNPLVTSGQTLQEPTAEQVSRELVGVNAAAEVNALLETAAGLASSVYSGSNSRAVVDYAVQWPEFPVPDGTKLVSPDVFRVHVYLSSLHDSDQHDEHTYHMESRVGWLRCKRDDGPLRRHKVELHGSMLLVHPSPDGPSPAEIAAAEAKAKAEAEAAAAAQAAAASTAEGVNGDDAATAAADTATNGGGNAGAGGGAGAGAGAADAAARDASSPCTVPGAGSDDEGGGSESESDTDADGVVQISLNSVTTFRPSAVDLAWDAPVTAAKKAGATNKVFAVDLVTPRGTWVFALGIPGPEEVAAKKERAAEAEAAAQAAEEAKAAPEVASKKKRRELKRAASKRHSRGSEDGMAAPVSPRPAAEEEAEASRGAAEQFALWVTSLARQVPKSSVAGGIRRLTAPDRELSGGVDDVKKVTIACRPEDTVQTLITAVLDKLAHLNRQRRRTHGSFMLKATGKRDYAVTKWRKVLQLEYVQECLRENQDVEFSLVRNVAQPLRRLSVRATMVQRRSTAEELASKLAQLTGLKAGPDTDTESEAGDASGAGQPATATPATAAATASAKPAADAAAAPTASGEGPPAGEPAATNGGAPAAAAAPTQAATEGSSDADSGSGAAGDGSATPGAESAAPAPASGDAAASAGSGDSVPPTDAANGDGDGSASPDATGAKSPRPASRMARLARLRARRQSLAVSLSTNAPAASSDKRPRVKSLPAALTTDVSAAPFDPSTPVKAPILGAEPVPDHALHQDFVRWPFRVRILSVDRVKAIAHRSHIEHGEEVITTQPLPLTALSVQVQLYFGGTLLPGCDMETRTVPFGKSARWMPEATLETDLNLRDIPPDSRIVFVLRGVWPEAVEPERIACVAVPLTDYRRMLVMGSMALRLWPNIVDVEHTPPVEDTVHPGAPILHVQFDSFLHPIVSPLYLADTVAGRSDEAEPPIEKMGWMHKLGKAGRLTKWKRRWFVLSERSCTLTYFASNLDDKPKGVIDLFDFTVQEADDLNQNYQKIVGSTRKTLNTYCFKLIKKGARTFYIYSESKHERREWMDNIARVISSDVATEKAAAAAEERRKSKSGFGSFFRRRKSSVTTSTNEAKASMADSAASKLDSGQVDASSWVDAIADLIADDAPLPMFSTRKASLLSDVAERAMDEAAAAEDAQYVQAAAAADEGEGSSGGEGDGGDASAAAGGDGEATPAGGDGDGDAAAAEDSADATPAPSGDAPTRWGAATAFAKCVNDPGLVYGFALVMAKAHSEENIMFWLEAELFALQCTPTFPVKLKGQHRLDAATRIFREYISKDAEIGDLADVTSPTSSPTRRRSSVANLDSEDLTVGLSGPCTDAIVAMLKAAHAGGEEGAAALTSDLFVEAQREISRPVHAAFRQVMGKKTLSDALGFSAQVESVMGIFERAAPPEHGALALAAWYRSLCNLRSSEGEAALKDATKQNPEVDPEYAAQCLVELNYSSSVGNFIRTQAGTGRTPRNVYKQKTLDAKARAQIYSKLWPASGAKLSHSLKLLLQKAGRLQGFLEKRWFRVLDDVPMQHGGLMPYVAPVATGFASPASTRSNGSTPRGRRTSASPASRRPTFSPRLASRVASARRASRFSSSSARSMPPTQEETKDHLSPKSRARANRMKRVASMRVGSGSPSADATGSKAEEEQLMVDAKAMATLNSMFAEDPLYEPDAMKRALTWRYRRQITNRPEAMPKFLKSVTWCRNQQVREAHRLVANWKKNKRPVEAIELLDERFGDQFVRRFAVEQLRQLSDTDLLFVLPQLVQALKYEVHHLSNLALFLLERGLRQPTLIGLQLFWAFKVEIGCKPEVRLRYQTLLDALVNNSTPRQRAMLETQEELWSAEGVFAEVCQVVKQSKKLGKARMKEIYREKLKQVNEILPPTFVLPIDPRIEARRVIPEECRIMSSAKLPLWLVFENADPDGDKIMVMFKAGDDLRQDTVTLQLIRVMDSLWRQGGMDLRLSPYRCISTWHDGGMLEIVRNAATTAEIQKTYGGKFGAYKDSTFDDWIRDNNPKSAAYKRAVDVFTVSAAGYVVATYLMGIGDRHNDNIMVKKSGHYFHIDFGHFLGNFKYAGFIKRERSRFVFTPEMAYVMGGPKAAKFKEFEKLCIKALNHLRRHGTNLINLFTLVVPAGMPELSSKEDINYLRDMLALNMTDEQVAERFRSDMNEALTNKFKRFDNTMHILKHG